ncbi:hypothetical protein DFH08DRAFT_1083442 [Mycena albidolilacea]|uniref:Uncharacterized protein n=1 Tax=Mycena albidolilacea TaxID=1033008 RepID=A0AAD6ZRH0_9AGAR|nr:hypothetical protein DFH08DRAFT_1083442 [Mycena albidolilacea]
MLDNTTYHQRIGAPRGAARLVAALTVCLVSSSLPHGELIFLIWMVRVRQCPCHQLHGMRSIAPRQIEFHPRAREPRPARHARACAYRGIYRADANWIASSSLWTWSRPRVMILIPLACSRGIYRADANWIASSSLWTWSRCRCMEADWTQGEHGNGGRGKCRIGLCSLCVVVHREI